MRRDYRSAELRAHFVSSVSHELKTPLTSIRMFAEALALKRPRAEAENLELPDADDHAEAGVAMRGRAQFLAAAIVTLALVVGGVYADREVGARQLDDAPAGQTYTGAWFCPHGGGREDWEVALQVANPGSEPVPIRVRSLGSGRPDDPQELVVEPGTTLAVPVAADGRERATTVEYFGGFVAAGWVSHAAGGESGVAAEPCLPRTGRRWLLPDGATLEENDDFVIVMNPHATDAVVSITLLSERRVVRTEEWTNVDLKPFHSAAFRLNRTALGETTVATVVDVSVGRVAASTLGVSKTGGIRSAVGLLGAPGTQVLPGGFDQGRSDLAVMSATLERVELSGEILSEESAEPIAALQEAAPRGESARTVVVTTAGPASFDVGANAGEVGYARRTYGVAADQGSTTGAPEARAAWIVLPAIGGAPSRPGLVLTNPGEVAATVVLRPLSAGERPGPDPVTIEIPPGRSVAAPKRFVEAAPSAAILAVASSGAFVPAAASYSRGREGMATYAVSLGIPVPDAWVPS